MAKHEPPLICESDLGQMIPERLAKTRRLVYICEECRKDEFGNKYEVGDLA